MNATDNHISYSFLTTSLGLALIGFRDLEVSFLHFGADEAALLTALRGHNQNAPMPKSSGDESFMFENWIEDLISLKTPQSTVRVKLHGTPFQIKVWESLREIPPGQTLSYEDVAKTIGRPEACRAVALACARNCVAIAIPCHRVIRKDGQLGGYRWGIERKQWLLEREKLRTFPIAPPDLARP